MLLPKDFCFENLIRFKISIGISLICMGISNTYSKSCKLVGVSLMDKFIVLLLRAEELHLEEIEGLQEVLHDRGGEGSLMERHGLNPSGFFNNLIELTIKDCRLEYLFSLSCARGFPRLQRLQITNCVIMKAIVGIEEEKDEDELSSQVINFSQLKYLHLCNLPKLISFYPKVEKMSTSEGNSSTQAQFLFNEKVAFPVLEVLTIRELPNIIEFNMLPRLQNLETIDIDNCPKLEAIVSEKEKEEGSTSNDLIVFYQLRTLKLSRLVSVKSFYNWPTRSEAQPLFNHQVAFPVLEVLKIRELPNIIEIWDKQLLIALEKESKSFCQLEDMEVFNCEKLVHVVQFNMLPRLQSLKKFIVNNCPKMEAVVSENEKEGGTTSNDIILFSQLTTLELSTLVSVKSFYNWPTRSEAQPLFNHQVAFPVLEVLKICELPHIIKIWDKQLLIASEKESKSFCQLKDVEVFNCEKLVHVVQFNMLPRLQSLKKFIVNNCPKMEAIVSEKEKEEGTTSNDIILFSQLTTLELSRLVSVKSFYHWPARSEAQPLFNHQVAFPVLQVLTICELPNIIEIWDKQLLIASEKESQSFCQLKDMKVFNCEKLVHAVHFNMLPRLQSLKIFIVDNCPKMEAIVSEKEKEEGSTSNDIILFSQLTTLNLSRLVSVKFFYNWPTRSEAQPLFNQQVAFPVWEVLKICELPNIIEIWDKQLLIASEKESKSFCQLKDMEVFNCEKLVHVVEFNMLPRLQSLKKFIVNNCPKMEAIVSEKEKEEGTTSNDIILFSQLTTLNLSRLVSVKSFYNWSTRSEAQPLFNQQVVFPVLEVLKICELPNIIEIWDKQLLIASEKESKSFCQLKDMEVFNCEKLVHVVQFNMLPRLQSLKKLIVNNCPTMEAVVSEQEKEKGTTSNDIILFSKLTTLNLSRLVSVKSFYNWPRRSEAQPLFNHQVAFPVLEVLKICELRQIIEIWDKQLLIASEKESKSFCQLKDMEVFNCEKLVHVVQFNMLPRLQSLKKFIVNNCPKMEAIVSEKEKEEATTSNDIILFSQLTTLNLSRLVSVKSFYNWPTRSEAQPLFNHQVAFPVLEVLKICELPHIIEIWDKQLLIASEKESKSFCQLKDMEVFNCEKLVHVVQFNMLPRLQSLKKFIVNNCPKMEAIVSEKEKEEGTTSNDIILFSQLTTLELSRLVSVKSFYNWPTRSEAQPLFNHQVAFPVLEVLKIWELPNIIEIWDKQLLIASEKESKSFCQLKVMEVFNCEKLVHVVQFNMLPRLQSLKKFIVNNCPKMEAIVSEEENEEGTTSNDIIIFSQLTTLNLSRLVSVKSFYNWPSRSEAQPLFNHQVAFPVLEILKICKLPNIIGIWDKQLLIASEKESKSFCQLKDMEVFNCEKLVHAVQFNMLPRLQSLKKFIVNNCPKMEAIVSEKEKEEGTTSNDIIMFSQLTALNLSRLVRVKFFYNWPTRSEAQPLFNHQVAFPVLEVLKICELPNIIEIWDKQLLIASEKESKSFCQLKDMEVVNCEKLVHVVPFNMLPRLQNLKIFIVNNCPKMEAIVSDKEKEEGTTNNDIILFSQLTTLNLSRLVSVKSFYNWPTRSEAQPLFNHQVAFPVLEVLKIWELPNIIEIWDKQLLIASEKESKSFCQLKDMEVFNCEKLLHVVQFNMLPRLQNLKIFIVNNCPKMEVIVSEKEKEEGTTNNDTILFSQLTTLNLSRLVSVKSFYNWPTRSEAQPLFNHQVAFPALEVLKIWELPNIIEIWDRQLLIASKKESKSFCQLKDMMVFNCEKLVHVVQFNMLPRLQNLKIFIVDNCPKMEAIVSEKEKEEGTTNNDINLFSQLTTLNLSRLVSVKSFYNWPSRSEAQPLFNHQVAFPVLEVLKIRELPNITDIWDKQLLIASEKESKSFCQLKVMDVFNCEKLVHVVQFNMVPRLQNLKIFIVNNCPKMESIVSEKEKEEGTTNNDTIMFSQLTTLNLSRLVSVKSFYNWPTRSEAQPLFNHQVAFPVLEVLKICELPNIIEIWDKQLLIASEKESNSFCQLKVMEVFNCEKLVHVAQFNMLPQLQNLKIFIVNNCPKIEAIVSEKEKEEGTTNNDIILFSQLTTLNLSRLVSVKSFYNWPTRSEA
ncbi:uncharacterized protein LOC114296444 [Camellia sinensis]|uniref:uncharacterized protein LOC114296444 n=1 Tax=Camellia sinensis TaxID=4442 RepID=UPI001035A38B|nr:uncharacterized protein LOC114296444 [Camellia sinensis]